MRHFRFKLFGLGLVLTALLYTDAQAMFMRGEPVPVDRLIANVGALLKNAPNDPKIVYTLGRLHSLAFAQGSQNIYVYPPRADNLADKLPALPAYTEGRIPPDDTLNRRKALALAHLQQSLNLYRYATQLAPKEGLYWFSDGWILEQGAAFAADVDAPFLPKPAKASKAAWRREALNAYRRAFAFSKASDLKRTVVLEGGSTIVSREAGQSILDLYKGRALTKAESAEKTEIEAHLAKMQKIPRYVTPLIFPLFGSQSLTSLTGSRNPVKFNLLGDGVPRIWPWVTPQAGILVWDPKKTGRVVSGRQLFGSVTWWIFWRNGFDPLAALDDNRDGWLAGAELDGIAVWQDKNGNGISDPGEVVPVRRLGVRRLAVHATERREEALCQPQGVTMQDGSSRPLYDWTPVSIPQPVSAKQSGR